jgi:hypothetical protein
MKETIKAWLKAKLDELVNVQISVGADQPDLIVHLWSGVKIHVTLFDQPGKLRNIKRGLAELGAVGVGSMFLVGAHLLPKDGAKLIPEEWLLAVQVLSGDRVYAYRIKDRAPQIIQAHFEPIGGNNQVEVQYGPAVNIDRLRFLRISPKYRFIKGDWMVADLDQPAFWKATDYRNSRAWQEQQQRQQSGGGWYTYSAYQTWATDDNGSTAPPQGAANTIKAHLDQCYALLGLKPDASRETVKAAFRRLALSVHPDVSALPKEEAERRFKALTEAYEYIKAAHNW